MPFQIVRNDIVRMQVDAIVNTANPRPIVGGGTDRAIHTAAGPRLLKARQKIGALPVGGAAITPGFNLDATYVIHTVGPIWRDGTRGEEAQLRHCYDTSLELAYRAKCRSVAFPLISTGTYGFPKDKALNIALQAFRDFLEYHDDMMLYLVVFHREAFRLSEQIIAGVTSYIDEHYVQERFQAEYSVRRLQQMECMEMEEDCAPSMIPEPPRCAPPVFPPAPPLRPSSLPPVPMTAPTLGEMLEQTDAGFTETLLKLMDQTGEKDSAIYKRANISKQHFSKIRNNPFYSPTKATAVALAIALKLDLEGTRDLIGRAGYALSNSSKFDIIIRYFIQQGNYNLFDINAALFEFDQPLLGA